MDNERFELYIIRHGVAAERGDAYPDDTKRPLSSEGMQKLRRESKALLALDVEFEVILTSPLVRTRQTAELVAAGLDPRPSIVNADSLAPGGGFSGVIADLEKHARKTRIALVGHEPGIGELAARLIGSRHAIEFKKGAICRIDFNVLPPAGPGDLRWFMTPRVLRAIKK